MQSWQADDDTFGPTREADSELAVVDVDVLTDIPVSDYSNHMDQLRR